MLAMHYMGKSENGEYSALRNTFPKLLDAKGL